LACKDDTGDFIRSEGNFTSKKKKPKTQHSCGLLAFKQLVRATGLESSQQKLTAQKRLFLRSSNGYKRLMPQKGP
jgi:hypothetical protein